MLHSTPSRGRAGTLRGRPALLGLALALFGCAGARPSAGPIPGQVPEARDLRVVEAAEASGEPYRIRAGDELEIRFFHTPDQNVTLPVRPDGCISLPLVYELRAAGRTVEEVREELVARCSHELADPEIAVIVRSFHTAYAVHVGGEVDKPGVLELDGPRTVLEAVFAAGGFLPSASPADVIVVRRVDGGGAGTAGTAATAGAAGSAGTGKGYELVLADLASVLNGTDARGNFTLQPYDVVYVPSSRIADVNKWVNQYIRSNIPITFTWRLNP